MTANRTPKTYRSYNARGQEIRVTIPDADPADETAVLIPASRTGHKVYRSYARNGNPIWITIPER